MSDNKVEQVTWAALTGVIDAATFVRDGYAEKVAKDECEVRSSLYSEKIISVEFIKPNSANWDVAITDTRSTYRTYSHAELWVTWTLPSPSQPVAVGGEAIDWQVGVEALIRTNQTLDAIRLVRLNLGCSISDGRDYVNKVRSEITLRNTVDISKRTLDAAQVRIQELEAELDAARLRESGLRVALSDVITHADNVLGGLFKTTVNLDDGGWVDAYFDPYDDKDGKALDQSLVKAKGLLTTTPPDTVGNAPAKGEVQS